MDPKAGLELLDKRKISLLGFKTRTVQPVAVCVCVCVCVFVCVCLVHKDYLPRQCCVIQQQRRDLVGSDGSFYDARRIHHDQWPIF